MPPALQALKEEYFRDWNRRRREGMGFWEGGVFYSSRPRCTHWDPGLALGPRTDPPRLAEIQSWRDPLWERVAWRGESLDLGLCSEPD